MTGIAGIVGTNATQQVDLLQSMTDALTFAMGRCVERHVDANVAMAVVSHVGHGSGPALAASVDGTRTLLLFGECFGYEEQKRQLEREGCAFRHPASDAEFCLRLYERSGVEGLARLSGSYALVLFDARSQELLLVSDRLGTRPIFYAQPPDGRLIFSTQLSALLRCEDIPRQLDQSAVFEFCALQRVLGEKTHLSAVRLVPPGSILRFDGRRIAVGEYWRLRYAPQPGSADEYAEELALAMMRSARHLHRGGGRVAMLLSGGLDARMVVAASEAPLDCYTFADYANPEVNAAQQVAKARGFEFHFLKRAPDHYVNLLERSVDIGGGMYPFNHAHAIGFIDGIADRCGIVTHGYVPELMFRGSSLPRVARRVFGLSLGEMLDPTLSTTNLKQRILHRGYSLLSRNVRSLFTASAAEAFDAAMSDIAEHLVALARETSPNVLDQFLFPDVRYHARYPSMLFEISLRSFMTERSLFFHNEVIDLHLRMPVALRSDKVVWMKAMGRLDRGVAGVVDANTGHPPRTSEALLAALDTISSHASRLPLAWRWQALRGKASQSGAATGYSQISWPRYDWMIRHHEKLRAALANTLADPCALPPEIFDHDRVGGLLEDHLTGRGNHRATLFALLTFGVWHKRHIGTAARHAMPVQ